MSLKHIIVTVDNASNDFAHEVAQVLRERGHECEVDDRRTGIHKKLDLAEKGDYAFILVVSKLLTEIKNVVVREHKTKMKIDQKQIKIVEFIHHILVNSS